MRPTHEAFIAYWKDYRTFKWRQLVPHVVYLGGLALCAILVRQIDPESKHWLRWIAVAILYVILVPAFGIRWVQRRHAEFIRCPQCGDWFGQDVSGAYSGPDPKFQIVIATGRCAQFGTQILVEGAAAPPTP